MYLVRRNPRHDRSAAVAIQIGLLFGVLATVTGAVWAKIEWGAWWNWDPRQTSILASLLFYAALFFCTASVLAVAIWRRKLSRAGRKTRAVSMQQVTPNVRISPRLARPRCEAIIRVPNPRMVVRAATMMPRPVDDARK